MCSIEDVSEWMEREDHSKKWLARECGVDIRTVQNWFSGGAIPARQQQRITGLMESDADTLHTVKVKLRHSDFNRAKKRAAAEDMPLDEFCKRAVIDSL